MKHIAKTTVKVYNKSISPIITEVKIMKGKTKRLTGLSHAINIAQKAIREKGITNEDTKKFLDEVKYGKK